MIRHGIRRAFWLAIRRRDRWEREVEEEIKLHLVLRAEQLVASGASDDDARREAVRRFGPLTESRARLLAAARHREQHLQRTEYVADLRQDLSFAFRTLRRDRGWTAITILTLALGIAATTAVFSVVSSLLLHAVAYPHPDRVVLVYQQPIQGNNTGINVSITPNVPVVRAWKEAHSFESLEAFTSEQVQLATNGEPVSLQATRVEPTFTTFAGAQPILGRMFSAADVTRGERVALLGEGMWRTRFGGDKSVLGTTVTLDDSVYSIIGVLPSRVQTPAVGAPAADVWLPINMRYDSSGAQVVARLRPGVTQQAAEQELDSITVRSTRKALRFRTQLTTPAKRVSFHDSLVMLAASVGLVLLVACANVAHLLMARGASRRRELAIRVALGAARGRVFRQLLAESAVLAAVGCTLGIAAGWLGLRAIVTLRPPALQALAAARVDATTLELGVAVTVITSLVFGLLGAVQSARASTQETLKSGGAGAGGSRGRGRQLLVVTEMALSATLVVGATMLVRSVINLQHADLGFEPAGLYAVHFTSPKGHFASSLERGAAYRSLATRMREMPGVRSVSMVSTTPGWFAFSVGRLEVDGQSNQSTAITSFNSVNRIGAGYFQTMGIGLVAGTTFTDTTPGGRQVILNEHFVRKQWPGESAVGKRIRVSQKGDEPWLTVVGVAADASTVGPAMSESTAPLIYSAAADSDAAAIMIRTARSDNLLERLRVVTHTLDPALAPALIDVQAQVAESIAAPRFVLLLTSFTLLALILAAIGLYGVMAYTVAQRTREIGIRVALGATRSRIARGVIAGGVWLAVLGCALGATFSIWGTKLVENELFGVARHDTASFVAAAVVLLFTALVACVVPARRALAVDPMTAIRAD